MFRFSPEKYIYAFTEAVLKIANKEKNKLKLEWIYSSINKVDFYRNEK